MKTMKRITLSDMRGPEFIRLWQCARAESRLRFLREGCPVRIGTDVHPAAYPCWSTYFFWRYPAADGRRDLLCMDTLINSAN